MNQIIQFQENTRTTKMKFLFAGILAFCISCVFSIEIDQNIETDSDQPENLEDSDVSFGKYDKVNKVNWFKRFSTPRFKISTA